MENTSVVVVDSLPTCVVLVSKAFSIFTTPLFYEMTRTYWFETTPITGKSILFGKLGPSKPTGIDTGKGRGTDTDEEEVKARMVESCQGKIHEIFGDEEKTLNFVGKCR